MSARQVHRFLLRAALSGAQVFAWIMVFHSGYAVTGNMFSAFIATALLSALQHTTTVLLVPLAARNMRHGSIRTMEAAVLCAAAAFFAFGVWFYFPWIAVGIMMTLFAFFLGAYRALYYIPYQLTADGGARSVFPEIIIALMPALAGVLIGSLWYFPQALYFAATGLVLLSLVPIYWMRDTHEGFSWGYRESFHRLFDRGTRRVLMISLCEGIEATALLLIWPIAAWIILDGSYPLLGVVLSATLLFTMVARLLLRSFKIAPTPLVADAIYISGWVLRYFAGGAAAVLLIDVYAHAGGERARRGIDLAAHEHVADNHTYVDEYTALKEMGQALGRILMCGAVAALALTSSLAIVLGGSFAIAALAGLFAIRSSRAR